MFHSCACGKLWCCEHSCYLPCFLRIAHADIPGQFNQSDLRTSWLDHQYVVVSFNSYVLFLIFYRYMYMRWADIHRRIYEEQEISWSFFDCNVCLYEYTSLSEDVNKVGILLNGMHEMDSSHRPWKAPGDIIKNHRLRIYLVPDLAAYLTKKCWFCRQIIVLTLTDTPACCLLHYWSLYSCFWTVICVHLSPGCRRGQSTGVWQLKVWEFRKTQGDR